MSLGGESISTPFDVIFYTCADPNCLLCTYNVANLAVGMVCNTCNPGYTLNATNECENSCGDGIINFSDVCDTTDYSSNCCAADCSAYM